MASTMPFQSTRVRYENFDDDTSIASSLHEHQISQSSSPRNGNYAENILVGKPDTETTGSTSNNESSPEIDDIPCNGDSVEGAASTAIVDDFSPENSSKASKTSVNSDHQDDKLKGQVVQ